MNDRDTSRADAAIPHDLPPQPAVTSPPAPPDGSAEFREFYRGFVTTLVAFLMWQGARLADATDIAQDTLIKAYQRWSEIEHPKAWTRTVASRALARHIASIDEDSIEQLCERSSLLPPSINLETWEQQHEVLRVLNSLPPRQRQVMAWTLEGYTPTEIAAELQIAAGTVRANLMKARRSLAAYLNRPGEE